MNPSAKLTLEGTTFSAIDYAVEWSLETGSLAAAGALADVATTATQRTVGGGVTETTFLVLPIGALTKGGAYTFRLTARYDDGAAADDGGGLSGYAALSFVVNAPPTSGVVALQPRYGVVLETLFGYACSGWVDDAADLPLLYSFYYLVRTARACAQDNTPENRALALNSSPSSTPQVRGTEVEYQLIADTPSDSFDGARLPQGAGNASEVDAVAYVADQLQAVARAVDTVVVCPFGRAVPTSSGGVACRSTPVVVTNLANQTGALLASAFETGDVAAVFQAMVSSSSMLNAVNCSRPCERLHRATCEVTGFCGACLDGYEGAAAPSNVACCASGTCGATGTMLLANVLPVTARHGLGRKLSTSRKKQNYY